MLRARIIRTGLVLVALMTLCTPLVTAQAERRSDPEVVFNTNSLIYHRASCSAARRCTRNCVTTTLNDAKKRGGRACKLCGGPSLAESVQLLVQVRALGMSSIVGDRE